MRVHLANARGNVQTAMVDFLFLLIISFLGVGVLVQSLAPNTAELQGMKQPEQREGAEPDKQKSIEELQREYERLQQELKRLLTDVPKVVDQRKAQADIERLRQAIANAKQKLSMLTADVGSLTPEVARLRQEIARYPQQEQGATTLESDLNKRNAELQRAENEKKEHMQQLAELQNKLQKAAHDKDQEKYSVISGTPMVRGDKVAQQGYYVTLSEGRVIPVARPYYTGARQSNGSTAAWPIHSGLTVQEALAPDSPLRKAVTTPEFRQDGRVKMLVNADSFAAFRVVRDWLVKEGIDYGWEPYQGTRIGFAKEGGRDIFSQGR